MIWEVFDRRKGRGTTDQTNNRTVFNILITACNLYNYYVHNAASEQKDAISTTKCCYLAQPSVYITVQILHCVHILNIYIYIYKTHTQ